MKMTRREAIVTIAATGIMNAETDPLLDTVLNDASFRGHINAAKVSAIMASAKLTRDELMLKLLPVARKNAHPPISNYFVGAVASGTSGSLYLGQNIEIPGNMLGLAVHGEQSVIANAYMADETGVDAIAVTGPPCGHCRQFLSEVSLEIKMRVLIPDMLPLMLSELLPRAFGPKNLGLTAGAFPVVRTNRLLASHTSDDLVQAALKAASAAYAPYSKSPSGVALATSTGHIFAGSYIENAAFNPSLPPLETALAGYFAAGKHAGQIQRAVLVEAEPSNISHEVTTKSVLAALAPSAHFERFVMAHNSQA